MGKAAYEFVDFLSKAGQTYWQMLPLGPTGYGDSPYQTFSSYGGNPYFIDLDLLWEQGLLNKKEYQEIPWGATPEKVDYGALYQYRFSVLKKAVDRFLKQPPSAYTEFLQQEDWLEGYSQFMALKSLYQGKPWITWEEKDKMRDPVQMKKRRKEQEKDLQFWKVVQYFFFSQWQNLKVYAGKHNIQLIGDLPFYPALDSGDVWIEPELFALDEQRQPLFVAGVPPDAFTDEGQLWGNPVFQWEAMKQDDYRWWIRRFAHATQMFDWIRIDHFRGFDSYYAIPAGKPASKGSWKQGPGKDLFATLQRELGDLPLIAEDLGILTTSVEELLKETGYPGMKVLQFAFDGDDDSVYLPHHHIPQSVVYTGTHDNDTVAGWYQSLQPKDQRFVTNYLQLSHGEGISWGMIRGALSSVANTAIIPAQDLLGLGKEARMNTPSTTEGNWQWRLEKDQLSLGVAEQLYEKTRLYRRV